MITIEIKTNDPYEMLIGRDVLDGAPGLISEISGSKRLALVTDSNVAGLYADRLVSSLENAGFDVRKLVFPAGEENKGLKTYGELMEKLASEGLTRDDLILALGGGVTGDMAGFCAATYLRGIKYVQMPTTFLAAVDSSVGGKTAVDLSSGKNLCGAFWQPEAVLLDPAVFATLTRGGMLDGTSEAFKTGMIGDGKLTEKAVSAAKLSAGDPELKSEETVAAIEEVVRRSVSIKADIVSKDEKESGLRKLLNFGHTIGHGIEQASGYSLSHGHAVALGMVAESKAAYRMGLTGEDFSGYIKENLSRAGIDIDVSFSPSEILSFVRSDKKVRSSSFSVIVPESIGKCVIKDLPLDKMGEYIESGM